MISGNYTHNTNDTSTIQSNQSSLTNDIIKNVTEVGQDIITSSVASFMETVLYAGWYNSSIGKMVGGTVCSLGGVYMLMKIPKQQTLQIFHSLFGSSHSKEVSNDNTNKKTISKRTKTKKKVLNNPQTINQFVEKDPPVLNKNQLIKELAYLALAGGTIVYGITQIISGLSELCGDDEENQQQLTTDFLPPSTSTENVLKKMKECPSVQKLIEDIEKKGEIKIIELNRAEFDYTFKQGSIAFSNSLTFEEFTSAWRQHTRVIYVKEGIDSNEKIKGILFELSNAKLAPQTKAIMQSANRGELGCEAFAKAQEGIEYAAAKIYHQITSECILTNQWPTTIDKYGMNTIYQKSFDYIWETILKNHPHSNLYRERWKRSEIIRNTYCHLHPAAEECQPQ